MPIKRKYAEYGDACATAHAVELIGDRWNYPVLRELMLAPKRFNELLQAVRGITPAVLTSRLRDLETAGLVQRIVLPAPARVAAYDLTPWARQLEPILQQLGRWAIASPTRSEDGGLTPDAAIQSMRTMARAGGVEPPIELALHLFDARVAADPGYDYGLTWDCTGFRVERGTNDRATTWVRADSSAWISCLYEEGPLEPLQIDGDAAAVERLVRQFAGVISIPSNGPGS
jgi:DNA-binding HxlR family transcriptional regulator